MSSKKDSRKSQKDDALDDSLRVLVLQYIKAHNEGKHADAELLLHEINTMRRLCDENA